VNKNPVVTNTIRRLIFF